MHRDSLNRLVTRAVSIVPTSSTSPGAQNFLISVDNERVKITSTDEKVTYHTFSDAMSVEKFEFQVPAKKFHSIVRSAYLGEVSFDVSDSQIKIFSGTASWELHTINGVAFPKTPAIKGKAVKVDREQLMSTINAISGTVARDVTRPYLRMISVKDKKATACDGVRFQQVPIAVDLDFQIPLHAIPHLVKLLSSVKDDFVNVRCGPDAVSFETLDGTVKLVSRNLTTRYPDVTQMMLRPALENKAKLRVDRLELINAVSRVRLTEDDDTKAVGLKLDENCLTVTSRDKNLNVSYDTIAAEWVGKNRTLVVNSSHLLELLKSCSDETCAFYLGEDTRSRKSLVLLKSESGAVGLLPQMSTSLLVF